MPVLIFTFVSLGYRPTTTDDVHSLAWHPLPPTHLLAYRQWVKVVALVDTARPLLIALAVHRRSRWVACADGAGTSTAAYWGTTSGIDDDNFGVQVYECIDGCICSMESCLSRMQHAGNCKVDVFCCQLHRISSTICLSKYQQCLGKGEIIIQSKQTQSRSLSLLSSLGSCGWVARKRRFCLKLELRWCCSCTRKGQMAQKGAQRQRESLAGCHANRQCIVQRGTQLQQVQEH